MVRAVLYLLISIFLISLVKLFIGVIMRGFSNALNESVGGDGAKTAAGGELKKCAVCGTYVPKATAPVLKGVDAFVCSSDCAEKYRVNT